ncbi:MAG TPA: methyltransferase domain-containing protein [Verrucomicrobiae bacterium]|jgi:hypothetical protein|nr:methyltransferase domain-containing protein [Verrucomicrobiae bacterium]
MQRIIEPEWLDELPPDDPQAIASRRDLRRLNRIMGNAATLRQLLDSAPHPPRRIVELGSGDGTLMLRLAQFFSRKWPRVEVILVDRQSAVTNETRRAFETLGWPLQTISADIFDWLKTPASEPADAMFANLFLHHFRAAQLTELFALAARRTHLFAACEPLRAQLPLTFSRLVGLIGCNAVTRHDAVLSVRAGFAGNELSTLWPASNDWQLREQPAQLFTHTFLAKKISCANPHDKILAPDSPRKNFAPPDRP